MKIINHKTNKFHKLLIKIKKKIPFNRIKKYY